MKRREQVIAGLLCGAFLGLLLSVLGQTSLKRALVAAAAGLFLLMMAIVKDRVRICLALTIFLMPLNINYYLFHLYSFHIGGAIGLYLLPLDLPLAFLVGGWFVQWSLHRSRPAAFPRLAKFFLPFFLVEAVSVLYAIQPSWAVYELVRWVRFLLVIWYFGSQVRTEDVWFCLRALGGTAVFQACLAMAQTVFRSNFGMDRLGIVGKGSENVFAEQVGGSDIVRGAGTVGHPNGLAPLLLVPVFIAFLYALAGPRRGPRYVAALAGLLITGGIAVTLSRAAWISFAIAGGMALVLAIYARLITVRVAVVTAFSCSLGVSVAALPFSSKLAARWSGRLDEAIVLRAKLARSALQIVSDHPFGGVGLNNFTIAYRNYDPATAAMFEKEWGTVPIVHNIFLLVWGETGTLGLLAYLGFWVVSFFWSMKYLRGLGRTGRCVVVGAWCGVTAVLISDLTSFGLWTEPVMYTVAVLFGLFEPLRLVRDTFAPTVVPTRERTSGTAPDRANALALPPIPEPARSRV